MNLVIYCLYTKGPFGLAPFGGFESQSNVVEPSGAIDKFAAVLG
jgi:hypothetical protein